MNVSLWILSLTLLLGGCATTDPAQARQRWNEALAGTDATTRSDVTWMMHGLSPGDQQTIDPEAAIAHARAARAAWERAPWRDDVSEELWRDAVLPMTNVSERREDWWVVVDGRLEGVGAGADQVEPLVRALNAAIKERLGVQYHATKRRQPDQGPIESMELGWASCTGLSILLADSCRTRGIPARVVGTPLWMDDSGNHTWVEVWADGTWHHVEAADPNSWDSAWFDEKAAQADPDDPAHGIFAVMSVSGDTVFPMAWAPQRRDVRGVDVTARYRARHEDGIE